MLAWKTPQIKKNPSICLTRVCSYGIAAAKMLQPSSFKLHLTISQLVGFVGVPTQWHRQDLSWLYLFALQPKSKHEPGVGAPQPTYRRVKHSLSLPGDPRHRGLSTHHKAPSGCCTSGWSTGQAELHAVTAALQSVTKTANLKLAPECTRKSQSCFCVGVVCVCTVSQTANKYHWHQVLLVFISIWETKTRNFSLSSYL